MTNNYDAVDIDMSWCGDFIKGRDGDIGDTSDDFIRSLQNEIQSIVKSEFGDWQIHPTFGASLTDFNGEPNSRETAISIENRIAFAISSAGIVNIEDIQVKVIPIQAHLVLITLSVNALATPNNSLNPGEPVIVSLTYNSTENDIFFLTTSVGERNAR